MCICLFKSIIVKGNTTNITMKYTEFVSICFIVTMQCILMVPLLARSRKHLRFSEVPHDYHGLIYLIKTLYIF